MKFKYIAINIFYLLMSLNIYGQDYNELAIKQRYFRLMFYNVENLFDTENDSLTNDDEFLPDGLRFWTNKRYWEKLQHISTVVTSLGGWNPPEIVGLCEIENRRVLEDLCFKSSLSNLNYKIIHKESPDPRGIDVAFLYQPKKFKPLTYKAIKINIPSKPDFKTRDILYVKGETRNSDTLHVFINHWPSRTGGQIESEPNRIAVSLILRKEIDSIFLSNPIAKIIIMGDMNDYPENKSLTEILKARRNYSLISDSALYNLSCYVEHTQNKGSHKYEGEWGILDQIIVSGSLLQSKGGLVTSPGNAYIYNADFLLENDETYSGKKNFRTYVGYKYHGGYSDHLPVFIDLENVISDKNE